MATPVKNTVSPFFYLPLFFTKNCPGFLKFSLKYYAYIVNFNYIREISFENAGQAPLSD